MASNEEADDTQHGHDRPEEPGQPVDRADVSGTKPWIGGWYETDEGDVLQVFAIDEQAGTIDVHFLDGTVDTWSLADWPGLELAEIEPPEGWGVAEKRPAGRRKKKEE